MVMALTLLQIPSGNLKDNEYCWNVAFNYLFLLSFSSLLSFPFLSSNFLPCLFSFSLLSQSFLSFNLFCLALPSHPFLSFPFPSLLFLFLFIPCLLIPCLPSPCHPIPSHPIPSLPFPSLAASQHLPRNVPPVFKAWDRLTRACFKLDTLALMCCQSPKLHKSLETEPCIVTRLQYYESSTSPDMDSLLGF